VPDPTVPENIFAPHGRGIYLMKTLMDEVRFEEGGTLVRMRKRATLAAIEGSGCADRARALILRAKSRATRTQLVAAGTHRTCPNTNLAAQSG
jgi:hypothetical protein